MAEKDKGWAALLNDACGGKGKPLPDAPAADCNDDGGLSVPPHVRRWALGEDETKRRRKGQDDG